MLINTQKIPKHNDELLTLATCEDYSQAEAIVDHLAFNKFPVTKLSIVADSLRFIEDFTGSMSAGRALLRGLGKGLFLGLFFGFIFGLFDLVRPLISAFALSIWGMIIGGILGAFMELMWFLVTGGRRGLQTISSVQAGSYKVRVSKCSFDQATQILKESAYVPFIEKANYPQGMPVVSFG